jgi:hypothetical protein
MGQFVSVAAIWAVQQLLVVSLLHDDGTCENTHLVWRFAPGLRLRCRHTFAIILKMY